MKITKFGHCCMLIEEQGLRILTDPGSFTTEQNGAADIDLLLITHEHADHYHIESVKEILKNNPSVRILTTASVGEMLGKEGVSHEVLKHGGKIEMRNVAIEGFGELHALIHSSIPQVQNVGFFIAGKMFFPGDAFTNPGKAVEVLALPVAGPWMKISEAIEYAYEVNPKIVFPVHDGIYARPAMMQKIYETLLSKKNIQYKQLNAGETAEF